VGDEVGEGLAGELVDDVQQLEDPAGGGDVELVVQRPHVIRVFSAEPPGRRSRAAETLPLAGRYPQAFLPPQTRWIFLR
jgi:hypothetical protein